MESFQLPTCWVNRRLYGSIVLESYHLISGNGEYTLDGISDSDSAVDTLLCRVSGFTQDQLIVRVSYRLPWHNHSSRGIQEVTSCSVNIPDLYYLKAIYGSPTGESSIASRSPKGPVACHDSPVRRSPRSDPQSSDDEATISPKGPAVRHDSPVGRSPCSDNELPEDIIQPATHDVFAPPIVRPPIPWGKFFTNPSPTAYRQACEVVKSVLSSDPRSLMPQVDLLAKIMDAESEQAEQLLLQHGITAERAIEQGIFQVISTQEELDHLNEIFHFTPSQLSSGDERLRWHDLPVDQSLSPLDGKLLARSPLGPSTCEESGDDEVESTCSTPRWFGRPLIPRPVARRLSCSW